MSSDEDVIHKSANGSEVTENFGPHFLIFIALQPESITKECAKVPNKNELRLKFKHQLFCFIISI